MDVASVAIVVAALCVNFGWQPSQDDPQAYEVLMQVEPELVDALHDSPEMAIESHVPASITPIRNIRVVVGTGELPRTFIAAKSAVKPADRVVRGQEPAPVERTTKFQNDDSWSGDRYATPSGSGRQYDALGATIGAEPKGTADANPWTLDSSQNASRDFGQELQNMTGLGGPTSAPPATRSGSIAKRWPAPPPTAAPQSTTTAPVASAATNSAITPNTWTSIRPEFAPPRLTTPPLPNGLRVASNPATTRPTAGPTFPAPPTSAAPPLHSVLSNPAATSQTAEQDWSAVWGTGTSTNSAADDVGSGMVPVPPRPQTTARTKPQTSTSEQSAFDRWPTTATAPATISNHTPSPDQSIGDRYGQPRPGRPNCRDGSRRMGEFRPAADGQLHW